jgi:hypothetical protein
MTPHDPPISVMLNEDYITEGMNNVEVWENNLTIRMREQRLETRRQDVLNVRRQLEDDRRRMEAETERNRQEELERRRKQSEEAKERNRQIMAVAQEERRLRARNFSFDFLGRCTGCGKVTRDHDGDMCPFSHHTYFNANKHSSWRHSSIGREFARRFGESKEIRDEWVVKAERARTSTPPRENPSQNKRRKFNTPTKSPAPQEVVILEESEDEEEEDEEEDFNNRFRPGRLQGLKKNPKKGNKKNQCKKRRK